MDRRIHFIGNAHIDPVWLWRWQEGYAEIKATFRSVLDRMDEFPDFIFTSACAAYYQWIEENEPGMFEEIKQRVAEGRWAIVGGWWIQPDCNIPSGESFVRHGLYSQRYFYSRFGTIARVGYNVDSFGHSGMLPQILKKSGMNSYVFMRPGVHEKNLPGSLFWWESADGSRVLAYQIPFSYGNWWSGSEGDQAIREKMDAVFALAGEQGYDLMNFFGVGNHGGGPTTENIHLIHMMQQEPGGERLIISDPPRYFKEIADVDLNLPVVKDDLQHHASGCYSAHSETKMYNRKAEHRLLSAEKLASLAHQIVDLPYPGNQLQKAWQKVLFNQFHDIMGGCCIREAYEDSREAYGFSLHTAAELLNAAAQKISWAVHTMKEGLTVTGKTKDWLLWESGDAGIPLVVFNPLSWETAAPIQVNKWVRGIEDEAGSPLEIQKVRGSQTNGTDIWNALFISQVPAMGYRVYWLYRDKELPALPSARVLTADMHRMENDYVLVEFEPHTGYIRRLYDKVHQADVLKSSGAVPIVIDEYDSDTWAHGIFRFDKERAHFADAEYKLLENGPLRIRLRVTSRYNASVLQQDFMLYRDRPDIEVWVKLDWREKHKLLKLSFPVNVEEPEAVYEIPYGFIRRPVNGEEEPGQQWVDVTGCLPETKIRYGLALLNDSKYSFSVKGSDMRMTAVRSPIFADHYGVRDDMVEYMDQGVQEFRYALVPHAGEWMGSDIVKKAYALNMPLIHVLETYHEGVLPQTLEGIRLSAGNIIAAALKRAEDEDGYILRCYETEGRAVSTDIELPMLGRRWTAQFGGCEIKTFYLPDDEGDVREVNLIEMSL